VRGITHKASPGIDLARYFERIGHAGGAAPTLETLQALHRLHPLAIPFENLTTLLGECPPLDTAALERKMVVDGRGGYCFEQNHLFGAVLRAIGFKVSGLAARVLWERSDDATPPRTHMLLAIPIAGRTYIADVGFGGLTLTAPIMLEPGIEQVTPHEPFRLLSANRGFVLQARVVDEWRTLYWFDLQEYLLVDFAVLNHFVATSPTSPFPTQLYAARVCAGSRLGLRNGRLTRYLPDGTRQRTTLDSARDLHAVLADEFGITLPAAAGLDEALTRVLALNAEAV
jgi:N-hydroxyarylamine O-acetyltransferase